MTAARTPRSRSAQHKYLTFALGAEHYGVPSLKVQEIIGVQDITPVPRMPPFVRGVINLRGRVIAVVGLRERFSQERVADTKRTCIIVVQAARPGAAAVTLGCVVDQVQEVVDIPPEQIEPAPAFGAAIDTSFIQGVGKIAKRVVMLLDIDRVLSEQELSATAAVAAPVTSAG